MALALLDREDRSERAAERVRDEWTAVRTALVSFNPKSLETLFPYYFPRTEEQDIEDRVEQDPVTPKISDDIEKLIAERGGTMTGADLIGDDEGWV